MKLRNYIDSDANEIIKCIAKDRKVSKNDIYQVFIKK